MSQPVTAYLPPAKDLEVDELAITGATLKSTALFLGKYCDDLSKEFMLCKKEEKDPRKCLDEGKKLTACGLEFYRQLKRTCRPEIEAYAQCIDKSDGRYPLDICLDNRDYFDNCMKNKMNLERPPLGYFSQIRIHNSSRVKPEYKFKHPKMTPGLPEDYEEREPKNAHGLFV